MYEAFYGFTEKPFNLTPDPDFLYLSPGHKKVMSYLTYGLETNEGFILVTGEVGTGKTTLVRNLIRNMHPKANVAYVVNPRGTFRQLMRLIMDDFGVIPIEQEVSRERLLTDFEKFVHAQAKLDAPVVIIFDEAQNLDPVALEEIRMLSNLETDKRKLVQLVLVGQPELKDMLDSEELKQLSQRIAIRCSLAPLSREETEQYIKHRLNVSGNGENPVRFSRDGYEMVYVYSRGIPRKINIACNATLLAGFIDERRSFDGMYVQETIADLVTATDLDMHMDELEESGTPVKRAKKRKSRFARAGIAAAVAAGFASWLVFFDGLSVLRSAFNSIF